MSPERIEGDDVRHLLSLAVLVPTLVLAADIPLSRDPQTYLVLGMQRTTVNSLSLEPPGCNVGVNCAPLVGERGGCGFFHSRNGHFPEPSQVVANQVCGTGSFFQILSNLPTCADPTCAAIEHAGSSPDCTEPSPRPSSAIWTATAYRAATRAARPTWTTSHWRAVSRSRSRTVIRRRRSSPPRTRTAASG